MENDDTKQLAERAARAARLEEKFLRQDEVELKRLAVLEFELDRAAETRAAEDHKRDVITKWHEEGLELHRSTASNYAKLPDLIAKQNELLERIVVALEAKS